MLEELGTSGGRGQWGENCQRADCSLLKIPASVVSCVSMKKDDVGQTGAGGASVHGTSWSVWIRWAEWSISLLYN